MGKIIKILFLVSLISVLNGCSYNAAQTGGNKANIKVEPTQPTAIEKTGTLNIYGNEPFTFIGLQTEAGEFYCLVGPRENELISNYQGKLITVAGVIVSEFCGSPENKAINVTSIK